MSDPGGEADLTIATADFRFRPGTDIVMRIGAGVWFLLQALIFFAVMASSIAWDWAPNPYVAALIGIGLAIGATQIVTGIRFLAAVLRRNRR